MLRHPSKLQCHWWRKLKLKSCLLNKNYIAWQRGRGQKTDGYRNFIFDWFKHHKNVLATTRHRMVGEWSSYHIAQSSVCWWTCLWGNARLRSRHSYWMCLTKVKQEWKIQSNSLQRMILRGRHKERLTCQWLTYFVPDRKWLIKTWLLHTATHNT